MTYAEKLKDPRWQKKRLEILDRDEWTCQLCMDKGTTLHVHHKKYNGNPWEVANEDLVALCSHCHLLVEDIKKRGFEPLSVAKDSTPADEKVFMLSILAFDQTTDGKRVFIYTLNTRTDDLTCNLSISAQMFWTLSHVLKPSPTGEARIKWQKILDRI